MNVVDFYLLEDESRWINLQPQSVPISNVFDLLGWLCMLLCQLSSTRQRKLSQEYDPEQRTKQIESHFDFLCKKAALPRQGYNFLNAAQIESICSKATSWVDSESEQILLLYLISYLSGYFDWHSAFQHFLTSPMVERITLDVYRFVALNSNYMQTGGCLIPNFQPSWQKSNRRSPSFLNLSPLAYMKDYLWIPYDSSSSGWQISHFYVDQKSILIDQGKPLLITASPCLRNNTFRYHCEPTSPIHQFYIDEYLDEPCQKLQNAIEKILEQAANDNVHIVVFPEMIASPTVIENICQYLKTHVNNYPEIICLPSTEILNDDGKSYQNTVRIVDGNGTVLTEYHKQHPFIFQDHISATNYYEPIHPDHKIVVFHVNGIGRIGIIICADSFLRDLTDFLFRSVELNLLLVVSYTEGSDAFFRSLSQSENASCEVIWCNTCAAYSSSCSNRPVIAYFSSGHQNPRKIILNSCENASCNSCAFTIDINPSYKSTGSIERIYF